MSGADHFRPEPFLPTASPPNVPWQLWKQKFRLFVQRRSEHFTILSIQKGNVRLTEAQQAALTYDDTNMNMDLFACLGAEGQRLFSGLPDYDDFGRDHNEVLAECDELFRPALNRFVSLQNFRNRFQKPHESATDFAAELRILAKDCNFGIKEDREIADQLVLKCHDKEIQRKLFTDFREREPSSRDVLDIMIAEESAKSDVKALQKTQTFAVNKKDNFSTKPQSKNFSEKSDNKKCFGCGKDGHFLYSKFCKAKEFWCKNCRKKGHFTQMCKSKEHKEPSQKSVSIISKCAKEKICIGSLENKIGCKVFLKPVEGKIEKKTLIRFVMDTGSDVTTITDSVRQTHFSNVDIDKTDDELINYDGSGIEVLGKCKLHANFKNRCAIVTVHIVPDSCFSVLGLNAIRALGMCIDGKTDEVSAVGNVSTNPLDLLDRICTKYPKLFSNEIGKIPNFQHVIKLRENAVPVQKQLRIPPYAIREEASKETKKLIDAGIIEQIDKADWVHAAHYIWKPDREVRVTVDFKGGLNPFVIPSLHPLPLAKELFSQMKEAQYFSKLDCTKAYFHVELAPESRPLTAFLTPDFGLCQYKRLPMGLKDSGAAFQKSIERVLSGLEGVKAYVDDIIVWGKTREEHDNRLWKVAERLHDNNLRLKQSKCSIAMQEVPYLGHIISWTESGTKIRPDEKHIEAMQKLPVPKTTKDVQHFLGTCNYFSDFIPDLATLAEPLRAITRGEAKFYWNDECQKYFEILKDKIVSSEVLSVFDPKCPTILTTDASDVGLGGVLSQIQDGIERPIAYASHTLQDRERNYSTPERECLGCVWGCEHFEKFLLGREFKLRTDQESLKTLLKRFGNNRTSKRISRWKDRISHFDFTVDHIKGKQNQCADILSRYSLKSEEPALAEDDDRTIIAILNEANSITVKEVLDETGVDEDLQKVKVYIKTGWPKRRKDVPEKFRSFFDVKEELSIDNECIFRGERLVIPKELRKRVLQVVHTGHPGIVRMKRKIRDCYFWPRCDTDAEDFVKVCTACANSAKSNSSVKIPVTAIPPPECPWEKLALDIAGPFSTAPKTQEYAVVLTDYFSKFPEIFLTGSITSSRIIDWLTEIFARFGNPNELVTDNGPQFASQEFSEFLRLKNIRHNKTAVYNPAQNGLVEVLNRYVKHGVQATTFEGKTFRSGITELLVSFRSTAPCPDGRTPAELLFGWKMRPDSDLRNHKLFSDLVKQLENCALSLHQRKEIVKQRFQHRRYGNAPTRNPKYPYCIGDLVLVRLPATFVRKGQSPFSAPMRVNKIMGKWLYLLSDGQVWNARKLKRYKPDTV